VLNGNGGADTLVGGGGYDTFVVDNPGDIVIVSGISGTDTVSSSISYTLGASLENLVLTGTDVINGTGNDLNNVLTGNGATNILIGGGGYDRLVGGGGSDILIGGAENDTYVVTGSTIVVENPGEGFDSVESGVTYTLGDNVERLVLTGYGVINGTGNELDNTLIGNNKANVLTGGAGADVMAGLDGNDTYFVDDIDDVVNEDFDDGLDSIVTGMTYSLGANVEQLTLTGDSAIDGFGNELNNELVGNSGNNTLIGHEGSDRLVGAAGADVLWGGSGDDTYVVDAGDVVNEAFGEGVDTVRTDINYFLGAEVENLCLTGTASVNGTGNELDNILWGNEGANVLVGGAGADALYGSAGDDTYVVDCTADVIEEYSGEGIDTVETAISYTLGAEIENLSLTGSGLVDGTGNSLANVLTGNSAANKLIGNAGNDRLVGGGGTDTMQGGTGNDTYVVDVAGDIVTEGANADTDTVETNISYVLGANVENLILSGTEAIDGTGNSVNNILMGNNAANVLTGGAGVDTMRGGAGNDTYVVDVAGDLVVENLDEGDDLVRSGVTYTLSANVERLTLTGSSSINGTGNTLDNVLTGNNANNTLIGNAGNDWLDGGTGSDTMRGGSGNDTYIVNASADVVTENANEGIDTVQSSVTLTLGANVENLLLVGTGAINGTGNTLDNVLTGNSANNTLTGGAGNDRLDGGAGNDTLRGGIGGDTYVVNVSTDIVTENANEGTDTIESSVTLALGSNVENLTLTGTNAINGTGNTLNNVLKGNSAINSLIGAAGNDSLEGLGGADTLTGGTGNDTYLLGRGYAADTVVENDATAGNTDVAQFLSGVAADQIWLQKVGTNLETSIIGTGDKLVVKDWYLGNAYHVEQFKTADGKTLLDSQVETLVSAMAAFAPPAAGETTLPAAYQDALQPLIAANWQ
jgi:Ca2+-binding RTX toxin-like protein